GAPPGIRVTRRRHAVHVAQLAEPPDALASLRVRRQRCREAAPRANQLLDCGALGLGQAERLDEVEHRDVGEREALPRHLCDERKDASDKVAENTVTVQEGNNLSHGVASDDEVAVDFRPTKRCCPRSSITARRVIDRRTCETNSCCTSCRYQRCDRSGNASSERAVVALTPCSSSSF